MDTSSKGINDVVRRLGELENNPTRYSIDEYVDVIGNAKALLEELNGVTELNENLEKSLNLSDDQLDETRMKLEELQEQFDVWKYLQTPNEK